MRVLLALTLVIPGSAWAWSPGEPVPIDVDGGVAGVVIEGDEIVVIGARGTRVYDATGALRNEASIAGTAVAARDPDGDGRADVIVCGSDGVRWLPRGPSAFDRAKVLSTAACSAVVWTDDRIVAVGAQVTAWPFDDDRGPGDAQILDEAAPAFPMIAAQGEYVAVTGVGGQELREYGPQGRSVIATGGAVGGLIATARGWTWSLPETGEIGDVTRQKVVVAPSPGRLAAVDADGNGILDVVVQHEGRVGVVLAGESFERVSGAPSGVLALASGDADDDGCGDLVFGTASGLQLVRGSCAEAPIAAAQALAKPTTTKPRVVPGHVSPAPPPLDADGNAPKADDVDVLDEVASEGVVRRTVTMADRPRLEVPAGQRLEATLTAPGGEERTFAGRGGPEGLVVYPDGRLVFEPELDQVGTWHASIRMWGGSALVQTVDLTIAVLAPSAEVAASMELEAIDEDEEDDELEMPERSSFGSLRLPRAPLMMDLCVLSVGVGGGATYLPADSWERVGRNPVQPSISPSAALACEAGSDKSPLSMFAGLDTAPIFAYSVQGDQFVHLGAVTAGFSVGGTKVRFGPYATAGLVLAGVGVRGVIAPFGDDAQRSGLEIRASYLASDSTVVEGMLMFTRQMGRFR